jgi:glycosyltransferase involved in cell wall biosynthesis
MHVLFVAHNFPSPTNPHEQAFVGEQVRLLSEKTDRVKRVTVLSPVTFVPSFLRRVFHSSSYTLSPRHYQMAGGRCDVFYPRYVKAPRKWILRWTLGQWYRLIDQMISRFADTDPVSVIHANFGGYISWASITVARRYRVPSVVTYQGTDVHTILANHKKGWRFCRDSFRLADLNLLVSRSLEPILRSHATPRGRCEVLLRGVDREKFYPAPKLSGNSTVLFVGRVEEVKGAFDLLTAWGKVRRTIRDASLTLAGPDLTGGRFLSMARALGVDDSIQLLGPVPHSAIPDLMRQSRILCLPSHKEGTPNCITEALSCGLPVVATRVGGIPDILEHQKEGLLVDKADVDGLAGALSIMLSDEEKCGRQGLAAQAFAAERLDARKSVNRLVELYSEVIAARVRNEQPVLQTAASATYP